jgi:predicted PurR-regulated permease PerM
MARQRCIRCGSKFPAEATICPACTFKVPPPPEKPANPDSAVKIFAYFVVPLAIEVCLAVVHVTHVYKLLDIPETTYNLLAFFTVIFTILLLAVGVLSVSCSGLEDLRRKIIEEKNDDLAWVRDYFRVVRKILPVYNKTLSSQRRAIAGLIVTGVYVICLALNGFIDSAAMTVFAVFLIWFGNKIIRDFHRAGSAKPKKDREINKKTEAENGETLTPDSTFVPKRTPKARR